uniref:Tudor domain-containing protein n=2 Tax=Rhodnius prolixus TaxID=13249 RepID=T1HPC4_RHOPR
MIIEPLELIDVLSEVEVRFLDYGERLVFRKSEVCKLPQGFVNRLPFQAIECGLAGIKAVSGEEGTKEALNSFDDLTTTGDNLSSLSLKVIEIKKVAKTIGDSHYDVVLINTNGEHDIIINEEIVNLGLAEWEEDMKEIVSNVRKQQLAQKLKAETANSEDEISENQNCSYTAVAKLPPNNVE